MKVAKFGGSSVANAEQIKKVCSIITADPERRLVVVSAPGKRDAGDIKVTDLLIDCAQQYLKNKSARKELDAVVLRYADIAKDLGLSDEIVEIIRTDLEKRLEADINNPDKLMDTLKAAGEDNCAKLVAEYLCKLGFKAQYINPKDAGLLLSSEYGNAQVLSESYDNLRSLRDQEGIMVFPGFFGYTKEGEVVTFPRGGSDITGSILAAAIDAELYENFTDVDSVFVANPNIIPNPQAISQLTFREMRELAYAGFTVLQSESLSPVFRAGIPVCIKNTNNSSAPGTMIVPTNMLDETSDPDIGPVAGIASDDGFCSINVSKFLMNREIGFGRKLFNILEDEDLSYEHTPSGIDNISVILDQKQLTPDIEKRVIDRITNELKVDDIAVERNLALIIIVGEGMNHTIGIAARATTALANAKVNIEMINQGSSEISMMFGVKSDDTINAVRALYNEFFKATTK
ncbi:aspartate kinase [Petroclostridium sp. X23]|uniref:aspartate kinase n=1 Tax=Petroclostridium sp. X23 TaxID=3045146 RepID=UPI0024AD2F23|nr:aspartate kinase [Petroclostridium sp. X23]WHH56969.1 aspartate kinase [Petroclostridium sp. X23]